MRLPVETLAGLCLTALVAACGHPADSRTLSAGRPVAPAISGPAADYPMVLGAPFVIGGVTYTPSDTLNYDQVGYATVGGEGGSAVSLAHRTLPLPSYVEVTSLRSGKTVLVRAERRGPMTGDNLVELSAGAAAQLGLSGEREPVRVRRVNPPEPERALLRSGQRAPERMDTPMPLVAVLMRKLEPSAAPIAVAAATAPVATTAPASTPAALPPAPRIAAKPAQLPAPAAKPAPAERPRVAAAPKAPAKPAPHPAAKGTFAVQVATFADPARAAAAARKLGGAVGSAGKFRQVRITGFASAADAGAALAKAKAAGYSDARIQRAD